MKHFLLIAWANGLKLCGALWWAKRQLRTQGAVVVFTLHRVLTAAERETASSLPGIVVNSETFDRFCDYAARNFEVADVATVEPGIAGRRIKVVLTFDDGWRDNVTTALPILSKYSLPAVVFVCPGLAGTDMPFWHERMIRLLEYRNPPLNAAEISATVESWKHRSEEERTAFLQALEEARGISGYSPEGGNRLATASELLTLERSGVRLGSHTDRHELLTMITPEKIRIELRRSMEGVQSITGESCRLFAYPNGDCTPFAKQLVAEAGFSKAFGTELGAWTPESDPFEIPRVNVYEGKLAGLAGFSSAVFEYTVLWRAWRAMVRTKRPAVQRNSEFSSKVVEALEMEQK